MTLHEMIDVGTLVLYLAALTLNWRTINRLILSKRALSWTCYTLLQRERERLGADWDMPEIPPPPYPDPRPKMLGLEP